MHLERRHYYLEEWPFKAQVLLSRIDVEQARHGPMNCALALALNRLTGWKWSCGRRLGLAIFRHVSWEYEFDEFLAAQVEKASLGKARNYPWSFEIEIWPCDPLAYSCHERRRRDPPPPVRPPAAEAFAVDPDIQLTEVPHARHRRHQPGGNAAAQGQPRRGHR